ncbi:polysaccharide export protein [Kalymmatonema gypsitolerans NIES-4073]|nr:polysaccharide export protein [Scytonema sp. NIES-4073]
MLREFWASDAPEEPLRDRRSTNKNQKSKIMLNVIIVSRTALMKYLASVGLLMTALLGALVSQTASAAPQLAGISSTDLTNQAQTSTQNPTNRQIHIAVIGEVTIPGAYFLPDSAPSDELVTESQSLATVTKALQAAGGITVHANVRRVQIRRQAANGSKQTIDVDLWKYLSKQDLSQDIRLYNGDVVVVPPVE